MNPVLTIFEDYYSKVPQYKEYESDLIVLRNLVGRNNFDLQIGGELSVSHYVGFFHRGNTRVQILPKIFSKHYSLSVEVEAVNSLHFIYKLLHATGYLKNLQLSPQEINATNGDLLELFISLFAKELQILLSRKVYKRYEEVEESQQLIKGKILFSETIRQFPAMRHIHVVRYDEFSVDNLLNRIFKAITLLLLRITKNTDTKARLVIILSQLEDVTIVALQAFQFDKIRFDRMNREFQPVFELAKLFFFNLQPGLSSGNERTFSFLIPLNRLFEDYIYLALKEIPGSNYQNRKYKWLAKLDNQNYFKLKPDFTRLDPNKNVDQVLDAKYKDPFNGESINIKREDLYQMIAYSTSYYCSDLVLIYPVFKGATNLNRIIAQFSIASSSGPINLKVLQIDIIDCSLDEVVSQLRDSILNI